jgi:pantothenate kinase
LKKRERKEKKESSWSLLHNMLRKWMICLIQEYDISLPGYEHQINITTIDATTIKRRLKLCFICKLHLLYSRQNLRKRVIYFKLSYSAITTEFMIGTLNFHMA